MSVPSYIICEQNLLYENVLTERAMLSIHYVLLRAGARPVAMAHGRGRGVDAVTMKNVKGERGDDDYASIYPKWQLIATRAKLCINHTMYCIEFRKNPWYPWYRMERMVAKPRSKVE